MKKRFALMLASLMILTVILAACGGNQAPVAPAENTAGSGTSGSGSAITSDAGSTAAPADDVITLVWAIVGNVQPESGQKRIMDAVNEYLASLGKNYAVDMQVDGWGTYTDNTNLRLHTGEAFDICFTANWSASIYSNAAAGVFTPLNDYLDAYPHLKTLLGDGFILGGQINGINYGMPTNKELARQFGWVFRVDIAEQMGMPIDSISTWDELEPWLIKAYEDHGLWSWNTNIVHDFQYDRIEDPDIGLLPFPGSREVIYNRLDSHYREGVKTNNKWFNMGMVNPNLTRESSGEAEFATGRYFAITHQLKPGKAAEVEIATGMNLTQIELNEPEIITGETVGATLAIPMASQHKDEAFDFINLLYTDTFLLNTLVWGQEGIDFNIVGDNGKGTPVIELLDSDWKPGNNWQFGDQFKNYLTTSEDPNKWEEFDRLNREGRPMDTIGFVPDSSSTEIQTIIAGLRAINETMFDLSTGYVNDVDGEFARFESEFKSVGLDELLAYYQAQLDAFFASR